MCTDTSQEEIHEARAQYVIDTVRSADDLLIVEQSGRAAAVIISLEEYRRFAAWRKERAERRAWVLERDPHRQMTAEQWQAQFGALDRIAERFNDVTEEELQAELDEALAATRTVSGRRRS